MNENYYLFFLLAFVSEIIGTVSGFGSSILFVPIASLFFDFKSVLGITAIFHIFSNLSKLALFYEGINRSIALQLGIPAVVCVIIGAALTALVPSEIMVLSMNILLVIFALYLMVFYNRPLAQSPKNLYLGGILSGFLAGFTGTGGAIRGITLAAFQLPKQAFIATSAIIDLGVDSSRAVVYTINGYVKQTHIPLIPFLVIVSFLGSYVGKKMLEKTSEKAFRYIVLITVFFTAVFQLAKSFNVFSLK